MQETLKYKGQTYFLQSSGRYFQNGNRGVQERLLHRVIWIEHNGEIPEGLEVHHKNGDWRDNRIENMELMSKSEHMRLHMNAKYLDPGWRAIYCAALPKAREAAKVWHKSEAGRAWHKIHGKTVMDKVFSEKIPLVCEECGKEFQGFKAKPGRICGPNCWQKVFRKKHNKILEKRNCRKCNSAFEVGRISTRKNCFTCLPNARTVVSTAPEPELSLRPSTDPEEY